MSAYYVDCRDIKGHIDVPVSKSVAHRYLICSFLNGDYAAVENFGIDMRPCDDVLATQECLMQLIHSDPGGHSTVVLNCRESGTTLRMLLPVVAALGVPAMFRREGSLVKRPINVLTEELCNHGANIYEDGNNLYVTGRLEPGEYVIPGDISSQYISGLLMAMPLIPGYCKLRAVGEVQSIPYIEMTQAALDGNLELEGDWTNAAIWLAADEILGGSLEIAGLNNESVQGDKCIVEYLARFRNPEGLSQEVIDAESGERTETDAATHRYDRPMLEFDVSNCPDIAPAIALRAITADVTTVIKGASRLRLKESDRLEVMAEMLTKLGVEVREGRDGIIIEGCAGPAPGTDEILRTDGDHRMIMLAALSSIACNKPVRVDKPESVSKSYPNFWETISKLGGTVRIDRPAEVEPIKTLEYDLGKIRIDVAGESHSDRIDIRIEGFPENIEFDKDELRAFMDRRHDGGKLTELCCTERNEPDELIWDGPFRAHIVNRDADSKDYENLRTLLRPGHADFGAYLKYGKTGLRPGGGVFSGRMTAAVCAAGGIAKQLLEKQGVTVEASIKEIAGTVVGNPLLPSRLKEIREAGDSCGGIVSCTIKGYPGGIGGPGTEGLEGDLARAMLAIPSAKGVEFGSGFAGAGLKGSENNDEYYIRETEIDADGEITVTTDIAAKTNNQGGISGGISTGMDITLNVAFKPVPSIAIEQNTVDVASMKDATVVTEGRHDVCIVPRVLPVVEAMAALVLYGRTENE